MAGFTSLIMQADTLEGELWYQHAASDMGSGPLGCRCGPLEDRGVRDVKCGTGVGVQIDSRGVILE